MLLNFDRFIIVIKYSMSSREDYAKLTSSDGYEFFVEREVIPKGLSLNMPY